MESAYLQNVNKSQSSDVELSEQQIVDCCNANFTSVCTWSDACNGGLVEEVRAKVLQYPDSACVIEASMTDSIPPCLSGRRVSRTTLR